MTGGGPVLRPSEHPFGIGRRRFRDLFRGQSFDLGDFFADVTHPGRFVALAPVRRGRQIGTVGFEHEVPQLHFARDLGQPALFKGHYAADSENEIAALLQFAIGFDSVGIGVENAPDAPAAVFAHDGDGFGPGVARMHGDRQSVLQRKVDLAAEGFGLLFPEVAAPVEVQPDFAHGAEPRDSLGRRPEVTFDQSEFVAPAGIVVHRRGVQAHHRDAPLRVAAAKPEQPFVAFGVDGREQQLPDPFGRGARQSLFAVAVERFVVKV